MPTASFLIAVCHCLQTFPSRCRMKGAIMSDEQVRAFHALPTPQSCRVIDFEFAQVFTLPIVPPRHVLVVRGEKPYFNMQVNLIPLVYIQQPEYWSIEVVGRLPEVGLPAVAPYVVELDLDGTIGTSGIEVIGANRSKKIDIADDAKEL